MIQEFLVQVANWSNLDPLLVSSLSTMLIWLVGAKTIRFAANRIRGNHLTVGEIASELLRHLNDLTGWSEFNERGFNDSVRLVRPGKTSILVYPIDGFVKVGETFLEGLNRRERRQIRERALEVQAALKALKRKSQAEKAFRELI